MIHRVICNEAQAPVDELEQTGHRLPTAVCALICGVFALISAASGAQVQAPESGGLAVRADVATLCALIGKMQVIALRYSYDPATAEPREIHPYAVGYTRNRGALLFGLQIKGYSKSLEDGMQTLPGWRNFRIDKIRAVNALATTFDAAHAVAGNRFIAEFACRTDDLFPR